MKAVILAGGLGTRISEETSSRPKPMVEIGGKPVLWHIMKTYSHYGVNDFIICCGYKGYIQQNKMSIHQQHAEPWKVTLVDTGEDTMTGGRIKRIHDYVKDEEIFCLTYGDGVSNVNIKKLIDFHKSEKVLATLTAVIPPGRFGALEIKDSRVNQFKEKPQGDGALINGGFFVLSPKIMEYLKDDETIWEREPLEKIAKEHNLAAYVHEGFWQPMDTQRDKYYLEELWQSGKAPWKIWS